MNWPSSGRRRWQDWPTTSVSRESHPSTPQKNVSTSARNSGVSVPRAKESSMWLNRILDIVSPSRSSDSPSPVGRQLELVADARRGRRRHRRPPTVGVHVDVASTSRARRPAVLFRHGASTSLERHLGLLPWKQPSLCPGAGGR